MKEGVSDSVSLGEARAWTRKRSAKGVDCPLCRQNVQVYRRNLNASMCRVIIAFYVRARPHPLRWFQIFQVIDEAGISYRGTDYSKPEHWGLLERCADAAGYWRITDDGIAFCERRLEVLSHSVSYNRKCLRLDGKLVGVEKCLGKRFVLAKLMAERPPSNQPS